MISFWGTQFAQVLYDKPDLIVVPECCDIPANLPPGRQRIEYYKARKNLVLDYFCQVARENSCNLVYASNIYMADNSLRNAALMINRKGNVIGTYYKNHLVPDENNLEGIMYGNRAPIIECDFGRVAFAVCFDLNFDQLRVQYAREQPDLIIFPSLYHGGLMQNYWAYSCRCHFVGAVAGLDSQIRNPFGDVIASTSGYRSFATATVNLDCCLAKRDLDEKRYAAIKAEYGSNVDIEIPPNLGVTLISSKSSDFTAREIMRKFRIPTLDDFFAGTLEHRKTKSGMKE